MARTNKKIQTSEKKPSLSSVEKYCPQEHGFWDYTTPAAGGMEHYQLKDYLRLLDDMQQAGMNSLAIVIKWMTTGYRSQLSFLDQNPDNLVIASDNRLLLKVMDEAALRGIGIWLVAVASMFPAANLKSPAIVGNMAVPGCKGKFYYGMYDLDSSEAADCAVQMFEEIVTLFPQAKGLVVEIEASGKGMPHRVALYDQWAKQHGKPCFEELSRLLECRFPRLESWREYTTFRRVELLHRIETAVRSQKFKGELSMLCETGWQPYTITQEVNLKDYHNGCPGWSAVSYECAYNKCRNRHGMMEMCIEEPRMAGLKTYYLPRGVMTWVAGIDSWPMPLTLQQSWDFDLEDIARYQPEGVWWFGSGSLRKGIHVNPAALRQAGFESGCAARQALLHQISMSGI